MDEHKEVDTVVESSKVTCIEHVGSSGDTENTKVDVRVLEDGGSCNGVDAAVGVSGSRVKTDGDDVAFGLDESNKASLERDLNSLDREAGAVGDSGVQGIGDSGAQLLNSATAIEQDPGGSFNVVEGIEVIKPAESKEAGELANYGVRKGEVSGHGCGGNIVDDRTSEGVGVDAHTVGTVNRVEGSSLLEGSADRETLGKEVVVIAKEESLCGELTKEVENGASNETEDMNSQEVGVSDSTSQDQRVENGAGDFSPVVVGSSAFENEVAGVVEKSVVIEDVKRPEGMEVDSNTQKVDVLHDKATIETTISTSSTIFENSTVETQVVEQDHTVLVNSESGNLKLEASSVDAIEGIAGSDVLAGIISDPGRDSVLTERGGAASPMSKTLDEKTEVTCEGNASRMDHDEISYSNIEGMDTDAFDENFCFSVEELQATDETASWSTENHYNEFADLQSSHQPTQVVGGEGAPSENEAPLNSAQIHSNVAMKMGVVGPQITDSAHAGLQKEQMVSVTEHHINAQTVNGSSDYCSNICLDSTVSCHSTQGVRAEVAEMDHRDRVSSDMVSSSSGNDQHPRTRTGCEAMEIDVLMPAGEDKREVFHTVRVDSKLGQVTEFQKSEQLEVSDKMVEHNSGPSTICASPGLDGQYMDGREFCKTSDDEHVGPVIPTQGDQQYEVGGGLDDGMTLDPSEVDHSIGQETTAEDVDDAEQLGLHEGREMEVEETYNDGEHSEATDDKSVKLTGLKSGSTINEHQASYHLPSDDKSEFSVSDLVWGKVRSHPWWPGQIFDPSDASEKAMKYQKKDCYFVAYFGDRTFAWNEASQLKSFRSHFSHVEKQSSSEAFHNAVDCALDEVSRRVELGLACSCTPKDAYDKIKIQTVENTGIQEELSATEVMDKSMSTDLFAPAKLVEYMKELAQSPCGGADRLDLVIARSQLLAFYRLKGYTELPEFQFFEESLENVDTLDFEDASPDLGDDGQGQEQRQTRSYSKRKHNLEGSIYPNKKERSLTELMDDSWDSGNDQIGNDENGDGKLVSPSSGKKRKGFDPFADEAALSEGRKTISLAKVSTGPASFPKPSFKIGECIRRVASQMTASASILKSNSPKLDGSIDGFSGENDISFQQSEDAEIKRAIDPTEYSSLDELLSQLHLAARDPLKGYSFFNVIVSFFSDFRNSVIMDQHDKIGGKRRKSAGTFPEAFEFEDMSDTYWTDRVIQNGGEEQPSRKSSAEEQPSRKNRRRDIFVPISLDKTPRGSRKQYSESMNNQLAKKPPGYVDENAPAELVMHFPVVDSVPSEMSLNKMFRRFGPIKEPETEVDRDTNRARVVFKKCLDAEAAYGSASKFNIFGQMLVNYQLNYTVTVPFKSVPATTQSMVDDASLFLEY